MNCRRCIYWNNYGYCICKEAKGAFPKEDCEYFIDRNSKPTIIQPFRALCSLELFIVNGIPADEMEFGEGEDISPETAEPYGCGNRVWTPYSKPSRAVLRKYGITEEEFFEIGKDIASKLSFGRCGWCI